MGNLVSLLVLTGGALLAWGLWLGEVCWIKGWTGLRWLAGFNWSALPICAMIVILCAGLLSGRGSGPGRLKFLTLGWALTMAAFVAGRWAAFALFSGPTTPRQALPAIIAIVVSGIAVAFGLWAAANRWLAPLYAWTGLLVGVALLLVIPLSLATIRLIPALNGSTDEIHAFKMGYPVFWTAWLVPLALRLGRRHTAAQSR